MSRLLLSCCVYRTAVAAFLGVAATLSASAVFAHHTQPGRTHPTVQITQQVMADGKPLAPGTYQIWITDQSPDVNAGAPSANQRVVQFVQNDKVVATEIAEVFGRGEPQAVGTSGRADAPRARVQMLRGGEFLRVSLNDADARYLIHLPTGPLNEPAPQPQSPSRIVLPSSTADRPANP